MCKKQNPAPEAHVCGWTWPLTSVECTKNFSACVGSSKLFFSRRQSWMWVGALWGCKFMQTKKIDPTSKKFFGGRPIHRLFDPPSAVAIHFSYLGAIIYFNSNLKAQIRNRRNPKCNAVPSVWLWRKSCISGWPGRLHPTAANRTQVDELPPSYICLPANLLFTLFLSSMSVSLFFFSTFNLAVIPHSHRNSSLPFFFFFACGLADCSVKRATMAHEPHWVSLVSYSPGWNAPKDKQQCGEAQSASSCSLRLLNSTCTTRC